MNHCKNCRHFTPREYPPEHRNPTAAGLHTCEHPKFIFEYLSDDEIRARMAPDGLVIEFDEGWGWVVGPEFGCVHFEH